MSAVATDRSQGASTAPAGGVTSEMLVLEPVAQRLGLSPVVLSSGETTIGSSSSSDIQLHFQGVQERHCVLHSSRGRVSAEALDPRTWHNNLPFAKTWLRLGDRLAIGPVEFRIRRVEPWDVLPTPAASRPMPAAPAAVDSVNVAPRFDQRSVAASSPDVESTLKQQIASLEATVARHQAAVARLMEQQAATPSAVGHETAPRAAPPAVPEATVPNKNVPLLSVATVQQRTAAQLDADAQRHQAEIEANHRESARKLAELAVREESLARQFIEVGAQWEQIHTLIAQHGQAAADQIARTRELDAREKQCLQRETELSTWESQYQQQAELTAHQHEAVQARFADQQANLAREHEVLAAREQSARDLANELNRREAELATQLAGLQQRQSELAAQSAQQEQLGGDLSRRQQEWQEATARHQEDADKLNTERQRLERVRSELDVARSELDAAIAAQTTQSSIAQQQLSQRETAIDDREQAADHWANRLTVRERELNRQLAELEQRIDTWNQSRDHETATWARQREELETQAAHHATLMAELDQRQREWDAQSARYLAEQGELDAERTRLTTWSQELETLKENLDAESAGLSQQREELDAERGRLTTWSQELQTLKEKLAVDTTDLSQQREELNGERLHLTTWSQELEALKANLAKETAGLSQLGRELDVERARLVTWSEELQSLKADLAAENSGLSLQRAELDAAHSELQLVEGEVDEFERELITLESELAAREATLAAAEIECAWHERQRELSLLSMRSLPGDGFRAEERLTERLTRTIEQLTEERDALATDWFMLSTIEAEGDEISEIGRQVKMQAEQLQRDQETWRQRAAKLATDQQALEFEWQKLLDKQHAIDQQQQDQLDDWNQRQAELKLKEEELQAVEAELKLRREDLDEEQDSLQQLTEFMQARHEEMAQLRADLERQLLDASNQVEHYRAETEKNAEEFEHREAELDARNRALAEEQARLQAAKEELEQQRKAADQERAEWLNHVVSNPTPLARTEYAPGVLESIDTLENIVRNELGRDAQPTSEINLDERHGASGIGEYPESGRDEIHELTDAVAGEVTELTDELSAETDHSGPSVVEHSLNDSGAAGEDLSAGSLRARLAEMFNLDMSAGDAAATEASEQGVSHDETIADESQESVYQEQVRTVSTLPAVTEPGEDEYDSVESYMQRLLDRNRTSVAEYQASLPASQIERLGREDSRTEEMTQDEIPSPSVEQEELEFSSEPVLEKLPIVRPTIDANKVREGLKSLRQVANDSARSAIARSKWNKLRAQLVVQGGLGACCAAVGIAVGTGYWTDWFGTSVWGWAGVAIGAGLVLKNLHNAWSIYRFQVTPGDVTTSEPAEMAKTTTKPDDE